MSETVFPVLVHPILVPRRELARQPRPGALLGWAREWGIRTDKGGGALRRAWRRRGPRTVRGMVAAQAREMQATFVRWALPSWLDNLPVAD